MTFDVDILLGVAIVIALVTCLTVCLGIECSKTQKSVQNQKGDNVETTDLSQVTCSDVYDQIADGWVCPLGRESVKNRERNKSDRHLENYDLAKRISEDHNGYSIPPPISGATKPVFFLHNDSQKGDDTNKRQNPTRNVEPYDVIDLLPAKSVDASGEPEKRFFVVNAVSSKDISPSPVSDAYTVVCKQRKNANEGGDDSGVPISRDQPPITYETIELLDSEAPNKVSMDKNTNAASGCYGPSNDIYDHLQQDGKDQSAKHGNKLGQQIAAHDVDPRHNGTRNAMPSAKSADFFMPKSGDKIFSMDKRNRSDTEMVYDRLQDSGSKLRQATPDK